MQYLNKRADNVYSGPKVILGTIIISTLPNPPAYTYMYPK